MSNPPETQKRETGFDKGYRTEYNARQLRKFLFDFFRSETHLMFFGINLIVLVIIIVLLALISGQEPIPVGQKADAR